MKLFIDFIYQRIWKFYYYRTYIWPFANIIYGYAITTHKSQGSTYIHTFVNVSNIVGCQKVSSMVRAKSLYTAITRAAQSVNILYQKQTLYPIVPVDLLFKCQWCHQVLKGNMYSPVNYTIDRTCADRLLDQIKSMYLYTAGDYVILSDKNKNLYKIPCTNLSDQHINEAYNYIIDHALLRAEIERYQYSNLMMVKMITNS